MSDAGGVVNGGKWDLCVYVQDSVPFTAMLSPRWASVRISSQLVMVKDVPPPPLAEVSRGSRDETAGRCQLREDGGLIVGVYSLPIVSTRPVNMV